MTYLKGTLNFLEKLTPFCMRYHHNLFFLRMTWNFSFVCLINIIIKIYLKNIFLR